MFDLSYLAEIPGVGISPQAPGDVGAKTNTFLSYGLYFAMIAAVGGLIALLAGWAISRREGSSEEVTSNLIRWGAAALGLGSIGSIISVIFT